MATIPKDYELQPGDNDPPVLWIVQTDMETGFVDAHDEVIDRWFSAKGARLKSFDHDEEGVHFLLTQKGTTLHTDKAYARYSHQLVIRNDGNRLRGFTDPPPSEWHMPLRPGVMYCLDTHSPHQGLNDPRMFPLEPVRKLVAAVDRHEPLTPEEALPLLRRMLDQQLEDWDKRGTHTRTARASF